MPLRATPDRRALPDAVRSALRARMEGELALPVLPATAARVVAACQDEHSDLSELAALVQHDQSLAVHVLRVANSVAYAPREPILSVKQAIGRLGLSTISDIALAVALKERVFSVSGHETRIQELWRHSTISACYAREIAQLLQRNLESAFLCGLLHDVGMPLTLQALCDLERERVVPPLSAALVEAAMEEFHCEFGARIAQAWRLGPWINSAVRFHHDPAGAKFLRDEILVVALADLLADTALEEPEHGQEIPVEHVLVQDLCLQGPDLDALVHRREHVLESALALS